MIRINDRTVELTDHEQAARDLFHRLLDQGYDLQPAADIVRTITSDRLGDEFYTWLVTP